MCVSCVLIAKCFRIWLGDGVHIFKNLPVDCFRFWPQLFLVIVHGGEPRLRISRRGATLDACSKVSITSMVSGNGVHENV